MTETAPGARVRYWLPCTGPNPQAGQIVALRPVPGFAHLQEAEVQTDEQPPRRIYLCAGAIWGYEVLSSGGEGE